MLAVFNLFTISVSVIVIKCYYTETAVRHGIGRPVVMNLWYRGGIVIIPRRQRQYGRVSMARRRGDLWI